MRKFVYIAGPITIGDTLGHVRRACEVWRELAELGIPAICPHWSALQQMVAPLGVPDTYRAWLDYDKRLMSVSCCALLRLPGESRGADEEVAHAWASGIPVFQDAGELARWWHDPIAHATTPEVTK